MSLDQNEYNFFRTPFCQNNSVFLIIGKHPEPKINFTFFVLSSCPFGYPTPP